MEVEALKKEVEDHLQGAGKAQTFEKDISFVKVSEDMLGAIFS